MAGEPSLGEAIGLQATVDNSWMQAMMRNRQLAAGYEERAARRKADEDAAEKKRSAALEANIDIKGVHPIFINEAKDKVNGTLSNMHSYVKNAYNDDYFNDPKHIEDYNNTKGYLGAAQEGSRVWEMIDKSRMDQQMAQNKVELTPYAKELFAERDKSVDLGRPTQRLKELTGNQYGFAGPDTMSRLYQKKPFDLTNFTKGYVPKLGITSWKNTTDKGDVFETIIGSGISGNDLKENLRQVIVAGDEPGIRALEIYGGPNGDIEKAVEGWYNFAKGFVKTSSAKTLSQKTTGGYSKEDLGQALKEDFNVGDQKVLATVNIPGVGDFDLGFNTQKTFKGATSIPTGQKTTTIVLPKGTIDQTTGKVVEVPNVSKSATFATRFYAPVNKETGEIVNNDAESEALKSQGKLEYKDMVAVVTTDKDPALYREGEVPVTHKYYIPNTEQTKAVFRKNGIDTKQVDEELNALNGKSLKESSAKAPTSKPISSTEFNAQWSKLKKGQKLVGPDGKTYTKK